MRKLQAAMFAAPFALILNNAIAENAKPDQEKAQTQTDAVERKIGRGQGTDWTGPRVETQADDARGAPSSGNAELAMTCQGKTGLDEPLSSLDPELNLHLRKEILRLHAELSFTLVYVTHSVEEAVEVGSRVVAMQSTA
jgi:ABC-type histidine transport system ATPase subunit